MSEHEGPAERAFPPFQAIVEPMTEAVLVLDHTGIVVAVNDALVSLLEVGDRRSALRPIAEYGRFIREWRVAGR